MALVAKRNLTMQSAMQSEVGASGPLPCVPVINGHQHRRGTESLQTHRWREMDSNLYGAFPCQVVFIGLLPVLSSEREGPFFIPSPTIRFPERARNGVKGPKR